MLDKLKVLVFKSDIFKLLSFISFHVAPSNATISPSVEELGQRTSPAPCPSAQSSTVKLLLSPLVSVIVTVVVFHALELVTLAIQFPVGHVSPVSHLGIPKLNTAAEEVPLLVTVALSQASKVVVVPTLIVAANPVSHLSPFKSTLALVRVTTFQSSSVKSISSPLKAALTIAGQVCPVSHLSPLGIVKLNTAAPLVPTLVTEAEVPAAHVVVDPTAIVAAVPVSPFSHLRLEY